jgi:hypothetical protein
MEQKKLQQQRNTEISAKLIEINDKENMHRLKVLGGKVEALNEK